MFNCILNARLDLDFFSAELLYRNLWKYCLLAENREILALYSRVEINVPKKIHILSSLL